MSESGLWGTDGFDQGDILDSLNPLHHIPIVGSIYRAVTEDDIAAAPKMIGGGLYGGPFGLVTSAVDALLKAQTGKDAGEHVLDYMDGISKEPNPATEFINQLDQATLDQSIAPLFEQEVSMERDIGD